MSTTSAEPISAIPKPPPSFLRPTTTSSSSDSDDESQTFHDAATHFSPEDEATLLAESHTTKSEANTLFNQKRYSEAISIYDHALSSCPNYLDYEIAVLKSNIAACHINLKDWKNVIESATEALDNLDRIDPLSNQDKGKDKTKKNQHGPPKSPTTSETNQNNSIIEIPPEEDETTALTRLSISDTARTSIARIRLKSLLHRACALHNQNTWSFLTPAKEDYKLLLTLLTSPPTSSSSFSSSSSPEDLKTLLSALQHLPNEINSAKEKEMAEMMGKLKELGNGILKPFGLSTENFRMVKDQATGGYNMSFEQGAGGK
jgi:tetratricopeptide (TPR) repeat protein